MLSKLKAVSCLVNCVCCSDPDVVCACVSFIIRNAGRISHRN